MKFERVSNSAKYQISGYCYRKWIFINETCILCPHLIMEEHGSTLFSTAHMERVSTSWFEAL